ncbi:MAG: hypothetical protein JW984_13555 [Deltaproteobacteria bacterium]|uniref:Uncharacterized protein n=1 Tax=Candidatus Zymogenus saltonus TaxID=2844893 RepID=A0A9D8PQS4_9DELT|nr:hypothetical protein [Candidatus Zymogenus saltonus]
MATIKNGPLGPRRKKPSTSSFLDCLYNTFFPTVCKEKNDKILQNITKYYKIVFIDTKYFLLSGEYSYLINSESMTQLKNGETVFSYTPTSARRPEKAAGTHLFDRPAAPVNFLNYQRVPAHSIIEKGGGGKTKTEIESSAEKTPNKLSFNSPTSF